MEREKSAGQKLLMRVLAELDALSACASEQQPASTAAPLPSRLSTGALAWASVAAASTLAGADPRSLDLERIAAAYQSDRLLRVGGKAAPLWAELSGFWPTANGWVRTHANYPHHRAALLTALRCHSDADPTQMAKRIAMMTTDEVVSCVTMSGGLAVPVAHEVPQSDARWRTLPLVTMQSTPDSSPLASAVPSDHSLSGVRVLDLTRVIAGPVCTRTLALLGADVLRVDPPQHPELPWQHLDTGHGKRSTVLDVSSKAFHELLAQADVIVLGYRPAGLARRGLSPESLAASHPGVIIAQLSAWGDDEPERRGFDSLVQAESGIAWLESADGTRPGALPAQALDHSAGYLLAAAIMAALRQRQRHGQGSIVRTSLRRIAAELLGMPRTAEPSTAVAHDTARHTQDFTVGTTTLLTARAALPGYNFIAPRPWGTDQPAW